MLYLQTKQQFRPVPLDCKPVVVHFSPWYDSSETHQRVHNHIVQLANCVRIRVKTWREFVESIREEEPNFITIHQSIIDINHHSVEEFGDTIQSLVQYLPKNKYNQLVPVAIGIEKDTTQQFVESLKQAGFAGIWPTGATFGVDGCVAAMKEFLSNKEYWPEKTIGQLPSVPVRPIHICFRSDVHEYITPAMREDFARMLNLDIAYCAGWSDLHQAIDRGADQMIVHTGMLEHLNLTATQIIEMIHTRMTLSGRTMAIMVGIEPETPLSVVRELKKTTILGICPSAVHWGTKETSQAVQALIDRQAHWPRHIIDQLPGNRPNVIKNTNGITLTARQQEVADLICRRGLSNKQIAKTLMLSESTVKIHVSAVLKSFGVRNRTQLALSAGTGLKA
jgi:DNA-binding NarL/FixJ family response regulator